MFRMVDAKSIKQNVLSWTAMTLLQLLAIHPFKQREHSKHFHHTPILCLADDGSFDLNCRQSIYMANLVELSGVIDGGLLNGKWRWLHCIFEMGICHICNVIYQPMPGSWLGLIA